MYFLSAINHYLPFVVKAEAKQNPKSEYRNPKQIRNSNSKIIPKQVVWNFGFWSFVHCFGFRISRFGFLPFGCVLYGFYDLHIAGTHAKISRQRSANFLFGWIGITLQKSIARYHHAWRAVTALKSVVLDERFLYRA